MATDVTGDYVDFVKKQYMEVRSVHENLAKSYYKAASWHDEQMKNIDKMMEEIPAKSIDKSIDNTDQRREDLIAILKDHVEEYGSLGISPESFASIILG
jgi:hypothetical protein